MKVKKIKKAMDGFLIFFGIFLCSYAILTTKWNWTLDGDKAPQTYGVFSMVAHALFGGELPLWNPYLYGGIANAGAPISEAFYPVNWILCFLFWNRNTEMLSYAIVPANLAFHLSLYFTGLYLLCKKLQISSFSSFIISVLSVCSFSIASFGEWLVFLNGFCWFPLLVLFEIKALESNKGEKRYIWALAVIFAVEASISVSVMLVMSVFFAAILLLVYLVWDKFRFSLLRIGTIFCAGILGILMSAPAVMTTVTYLINGARYVPEIGFVYGIGEKLPLESFKGNSATIDDLQKIFYFLPTRSWLSIGGLILLFVIIGIFSSKKADKRIYIWAMISGIFSLFYCLGCLFPDLIYYIPFLNNLRETYMYAVFLNFFCAVLAANGAFALETAIKERQKWSEWLKYRPIMGLILTILVLYNILPHHGSKAGIIYTLAVIVLIGALGFIDTKKGIKYVISLLIAICFCINYSHYYLVLDQVTYSESDALNKISEVNQYNKEVIESIDDQSIFRIEGNSCYPQNFGCVAGFYETSGYFNPTTASSVQIYDLDYFKRLQLQNVKYVMVGGEGNSGLQKYRMNEEVTLYPTYVSEEPQKVNLYKIPDVLGNAWAVNKFEIYDYMQEEEVVNKINESDLSQVVYIEQNRLEKREEEILSAINNSKEMEFQLISLDYRKNKIVYDVNSNQGAIMITSELFYPGWKVWINGSRGKVLKVDYVNRGVMIPEGSSKIEFVYQPIELVLGVIFQVCVCMIGIGMGIKVRRRK